MTDDEIAAAQAFLQQWSTTWTQAWEAWQRELRLIICELVRLWQRIAMWIERQGILSPAYAFASPAMRRRAAHQRARIAMQAKNRRLH